MTCLSVYSCRMLVLTHGLLFFVVDRYHTFQGACEVGDEILDTSPEKMPAFGCAQIVGRDTCSGKWLASSTTKSTAELCFWIRITQYVLHVLYC